MSSPSKLSIEMVLDLDRRDQVPLVSGLCQNKDDNGIICGKWMTFHIGAQKMQNRCSRKFC